MRPTQAQRAERRFALDLCAILVTLIAAGGALAASADETAAAGTAPEAAAGVQTAGPDAASGPAATPPKVAFSTGRQVKTGAALAGKARDDEAPKSKLRNAPRQALDTGFWFYDAAVELYYDDDRDGYFYGLDVFFDADTDYAGANVYARLYLSLDGGPWELYYTTGVFQINGATGDDEFVVETELFDGYPSGMYDVLIELYDADYEEFVAEFGPADTSALSLLPLEDQKRDAPFVLDTIVVSGSGGGGALGIGVLVLALVGLGRRWKRSPRA